MDKAYVPMISPSRFRRAAARVASAACAMSLMSLMLVGAARATTNQTVAQIAGAWMPVNAEWHKMPPEIEPDTSTAAMQVLYFEPGGRIAVIGCLIYRRPGERDAMSAGDGHLVSIGDWHEENGQIVARWRLMFRDVQKVGEQLPGPWTDHVLTLDRAELSFDGEAYRPAPDLDKDAAELIPKPIDADYKRTTVCEITARLRAGKFEFVEIEGELVIAPPDGLIFRDARCPVKGIGVDLDSPAADSHVINLGTAIRLGHQPIHSTVAFRGVLERLPKTNTFRFTVFEFVDPAPEPSAPTKPAGN
jgi:hypothetical protein